MEHVPSYDSATLLETTSITFSIVTAAGISSGEIVPPGGPNWPGWGIWGTAVIVVGGRLKVRTVNDGGGVVSNSFTMPRVWADVRFNNQDGNISTNIFGAGIPSQGGNPLQRRDGSTSIVLDSEDCYTPIFLPYRNDVIGIALNRVYFDYGTIQGLQQAIDFEVNIMYYPIRQPTQLPNR